MENKPNINKPVLPGQAPKINKPIMPGQKTVVSAPNGKENKKPNANEPKPVHIKSDSSLKEDNPVSILAKKPKKFLIVMIAGLLAVAIITTLIFILLPKPTNPADIYINFETASEIDIDGDHQPGEVIRIMPNGSYNSTFSVKSTVDTENEAEPGPVYVRIKVYCLVENNYYADIMKLGFDTDEWYDASDGYLYLKEELQANAEKVLCTKLIFDKDIGNDFQGKRIDLFFIGECVQAGALSGAAIDVYWPTAPYEWRQLFNNSWSL